MLKLTCRLCNESTTGVFWPRPMPLVDNYSREPVLQAALPLELRMCVGCGHMQLSEVIEAATLFQSDYHFLTGDYPWLVEHYRALASHLWDEYAPACVLEIGSNDGTLLEFFRERGAEVLGVDPSGVPSNVPTLKEFFGPRTPRNLPWKSDLILANHVFAHNDDLRGICEGIRDALSPGGVFVFETNYGLDLIERHLFDIVYHEHMDYHTVTPFLRFFCSIGLQLFHVERNDSKGGTLRGYVGHALERPQVGASVAKAMHQEHMAGATDPNTFQAWRRRFYERRDRLQQALSGVHHITGYGAAAGGIATLYHMQLEDRIARLVDDSPRRHGMFAPQIAGQTLPLRVEAPVFTPSETVVILSWRYAEQIQAKHPNVRMIVP